MHSMKTSKNSQKAKQSVYDIITEKILAQMEKGIIPWQKPWTGTGRAINYVSRKPYSVLNELLLGREGEWLTYKQLTSLGGKIKKGEKSSIVTFYSPKVKTHTETNADGEEVTVVDETIGFMLRFYEVYHIEQCEGIESKIDSAEGIHNNPIEEAENIIGLYDENEKHLSIQYVKGSDKAFFSPSQDLVVVPHINQFPDVNEYYSTLFHELTHSTGVKSRCDRGIEQDGCFGSVSYSKEELVAEIGAAMLVNHAGLEADKAFNNSVAYLQSWLKALKNDPKMIVQASAKAQQAVKYILNEK